MHRTGQTRGAESSEPAAEAEPELTAQVVEPVSELVNEPDEQPIEIDDSIAPVEADAAGEAALAVAVEPDRLPGREQHRDAGEARGGTGRGVGP